MVEYAYRTGWAHVKPIPIKFADSRVFPEFRSETEFSRLTSARLIRAGGAEPEEVALPDLFRWRFVKVVPGEKARAKPYLQVAINTDADLDLIQSSRRPQLRIDIRSETEAEARARLPGVIGRLARARLPGVIGRLVSRAREPEPTPEIVATVDLSHWEKKHEIVLDVRLAHFKDREALESSVAPFQQTTCVIRDRAGQQTKVHLGIDFGNSQSVVSVLEAGQNRPKVLRLDAPCHIDREDGAGRSILPSKILFERLFSVSPGEDAALDFANLEVGLGHAASGVVSGSAPRRFVLGPIGRDDIDERRARSLRKAHFDSCPKRTITDFEDTDVLDVFHTVIGQENLLGTLPRSISAFLFFVAFFRKVRRALSRPVADEDGHQRRIVQGINLTYPLTFGLIAHHHLTISARLAWLYVNGSPDFDSCWKLWSAAVADRRLRLTPDEVVPFKGAPISATASEPEAILRYFLAEEILAEKDGVRRFLRKYSGPAGRMNQIEEAVPLRVVVFDSGGGTTDILAADLEAELTHYHGSWSGIYPFPKGGDEVSRKLVELLQVKLAECLGLSQDQYWIVSTDITPEAIKTGVTAFQERLGDRLQSFSALNAPGKWTRFVETFRGRLHLALSLEAERLKREITWGRPFALRFDRSEIPTERDELFSALAGLISRRSADEIDDSLGQLFSCLAIAGKDLFQLSSETAGSSGGGFRPMAFRLGEDTKAEEAAEDATSAYLAVTMQEYVEAYLAIMRPAIERTAELARGRGDSHDHTLVLLSGMNSRPPFLRDLLSELSGLPLWRIVRFDGDAGRGHQADADKVGVACGAVYARAPELVFRPAAPHFSRNFELYLFDKGFGSPILQQMKTGCVDDLRRAYAFKALNSNLDIVGSDQVPVRNRGGATDSATARWPILQIRGVECAIFEIVEDLSESERTGLTALTISAAIILERRGSVNRLKDRDSEAPCKVCGAVAREDRDASADHRPLCPVCHQPDERKDFGSPVSVQNLGALCWLFDQLFKSNRSSGDLEVIARGSRYRIAELLAFDCIAERFPHSYGEFVGEANRTFADFGQTELGRSQLFVRRARSRATTEVQR